MYHVIKMSSQIETIVNTYKTLSKIPSILGGKLSDNGKRVASKWSVRNLDKGKNTKYLYNYVLDDDFKIVTASDFGTDVSSDLLSAVSPTETLKAVIREENNKDTKKQYLEVWRRNGLAHSIDLSVLDIHGDVYADSEFGSLDWSRDETSIVYIAEKKLRKSEPYIKRKAPEDPSKTDGSGEKSPTRGEEHLYREDWGEQLVGKHLSVIVVCRLETETFTVLEGLPDSWTPGQVRFSADGNSVVGVAWETEPRRLGLIFCTNRPSYIFNVTLDGTMLKLSAEGFAVRSPRLNSNDDCVWLQREADGPHHACHALVMKRHNSGEVSTLINIVQTEKKIVNDQSFYGIYSQALPARCFSADEKRILFSSPQQCQVKSYVLDIESGTIVDISNHCCPGSTTILDVHNDFILAGFSNMTTPGQLYVARLPPKGQEGEIKWVRISTPVEVPSAVKLASVTALHLSHEHSQDEVKSFTALYFAPESKDKLPLIVWPHGGPHTNFVNAFYLETAFFAMLGYALLRLNYRGSTGYGDRNVRCLIGHIGNYDAQDCLLALYSLREKDEKLDTASDVFLYGGSYGGFLLTHLAAQFPERCKAMVLRNPLIDLATKGHYADNSDGCAVEAGYEFTERGPVSEEQLVAMRRCSPLAHVHKVRAPTALMLGAGDKRVPHYQGLEYARRLKANGVNTRVYMYDDNHSLSTLPAEMDSLINSASWFLQHIHTL